MWIIRITPYLFCNSIQESNNSVFESRSCTHVLLQIKVYASIQTQTLETSQNQTPLNFNGVSIFARRGGEKNTLKIMCRSCEKPIILVCLYRGDNLELKTQMRWVFPLGRSTHRPTRGFQNLLDIPNLIYNFFPFIRLTVVSLFR